MFTSTDPLVTPPLTHSGPSHHPLLNVALTKSDGLLKAQSHTAVFCQVLCRAQQG